MIPENDITNKLKKYSSRHALRVTRHDSCVTRHALRVTYFCHPSSNIQPSEADQKITKKIKECGILLDMAVLDHIIVAGDRYYSFADEGTI